jgi:hypothetical protein
MRKLKTRLNDPKTNTVAFKHYHQLEAEQIKTIAYQTQDRQMLKWQLKKTITLVSGNGGIT